LSTPCFSVLWHWLRRLSSSAPAAVSRAFGPRLRANSRTPTHSGANRRVLGRSLLTTGFPPMADGAGLRGGACRRVLSHPRQAPYGVKPTRWVRVGSERKDGNAEKYYNVCTGRVLEGRTGAGFFRVGFALWLSWRRLPFAPSPAAPPWVSGLQVRASSLMPIQSGADRDVQRGCFPTAGSPRRADQTGPSDGIRRRARVSLRRVLPQGHAAGRYAAVGRMNSGGWGGMFRMDGTGYLK